MKTVEELLKDRYKVIADYPNNPWKVGDILTDPEVIDGMEEYPHLFKPLEWWEEIDLGDLPDYVRGIEIYTGVNKVVKKGVFEKYPKNFNSTASPYWCVLEGIERLFNDEDRQINYSHFLPATKEEFEQYN